MTNTALPTKPPGPRNRGFLHRRKDSTREAQALHIEGLSKHYGSVRAVRDVSLTVEAGEFVALLGPSGSGKSSLLMTVVGFERPDAGRIMIGGHDVSSIPTYERNLGVVFQRYALFPHRTVAENIAYPLRMRGTPRRERLERIARFSSLLGLDALQDRLPEQLSGGQQQRVALARALVHEPPVLLMDEPLGALDRKLRDQVQLEIRRIHREVGTTIVYVTHDQDEAMTMADRIAVMRDGEIQQFGSPRELYERPDDLFIAGFLGRGNFVPGTLQVRNEDLRVETLGTTVSVPASQLVGPALDGTDVVVAVRPESIRLESPGAGPSGPVTEIVYQGARTLVSVETAGRSVVVDADSKTIADLRLETPVGLSWDPQDARVFVET